MSQFKPMTVVMLMLVSVLAGCSGTDGTDGAEGLHGSQGETGEQGPPGIQGEIGPAGADGQDGMDANESRTAELEAELASKDEAIAILLGNISDMEEELDAVDDVIEMYYMMFVQMQNQINTLGNDLTNATNCQLVPWGNCPRADLSGMDLSGLDLTGINLRGASLIGTNLSGTQLDKSILSDVDAWNSSFASASINNADLSDSRFWKYEWDDDCQYCHAAADFSGTSIIDSDMTNIDLRYADLTTIFFRGSNLHGSDLSHSNVSNQYLLQTEMTNVILTYANLTNTQFFDMNLEGSNFIMAELNQTYFSNVNLEDTSFRYTHLISSTFQFCMLEDTTFIGSNMSSSSIYSSQLRFADFTNAITSNMQYMGNDWLLVNWSDGTVYSTTPT